MPPLRIKEMPRQVSAGNCRARCAERHSICPRAICDGQMTPMTVPLCAATSPRALISLTKSLSKEIGPRGVRVNSIAPGFIMTEMTQALPDEVREQWIPLWLFGFLY